MLSPIQQVANRSAWPTFHGRAQDHHGASGFGVLGVTFNPAASSSYGPLGAAAGLKLPCNRTLTFSGPCSAMVLSARRTDLPLRTTRRTSGVPSISSSTTGLPAGCGSGGTRSAGSAAGGNRVLTLTPLSLIRTVPLAVLMMLPPLSLDQVIPPRRRTLRLCGKRRASPRA